jgi:uncharacterized protein YbjT (DUF2867 family)
VGLSRLEGMTKTILVTGGTGQLGGHVVRLLRQAGHDVRVASRRTGPDLATVNWKTGAGLAEAVAGVDAIAHCAGAYLDVEIDRMLAAAALKAGVPHLLYISIVGIDRVPFRYYRSKLAAERIIEQSGVPFTILRATQFHDLVRVLFAGAAKLPLMFVPAFSFQPVDAGEVAERLAELVVEPPAGHVPDLAGPLVQSAHELAGMYLRATGRRRLIVPVRFPGNIFRQFRAGGNLAPDRAVGTVTFAGYLAVHPNRKALSYRGHA